MKKTLFLLSALILTASSIFAQDIDPKDVKVTLDQAFPIALQKAKTEFPDIKSIRNISNNRPQGDRERFLTSRNDNLF